jgi:hypothetical protein
MTAATQTAAPSGILAALGYISEVQLAEDLGVSVKTLANRRTAGTGPRFVKQGRCVLYTPDAIKEWLESGERS